MIKLLVFIIKSVLYLTVGMFIVVLSVMVAAILWESDPMEMGMKLADKIKPWKL